MHSSIIISHIWGKKEKKSVSGEFGEMTKQLLKVVWVSDLWLFMFIFIGDQKQYNV